MAFTSPAPSVPSKNKGKKIRILNKTKRISWKKWSVVHIPTANPDRINQLGIFPVWISVITDTARNKNKKTLILSPPIEIKKRQVHPKGWTRRGTTFICNNKYYLFLITDIIRLKSSLVIHYFIFVCFHLTTNSL